METHVPMLKKRSMLVGIFIAILAGVFGYWYIQKKDGLLINQQEPKTQLPYKSEDVTFINQIAGITLSGTLTIPRETGRKFPAIILISGYGPQNRDAEWNGHKPFLLIADHLTRRGFAVLRYDDRGFGQSTGDYHSSTSFDFSIDIERAITFLKSRDDIDHQHIGLIGHSDGAMVATILAARSKDVSCIVLLGAPGIRGRELFVERQVFIDRKIGKSEPEVQETRRYLETLVNIISEGRDQERIRNDLQEFASKTKNKIPDDQLPPGMTKEEFITRQISMLTSPWFKYFFSYDPAESFSKIKCPVLALTGDKDVQAPPILNLAAISDGIKLNGNNDVTAKTLSGINHMFQECNTGMIDEYATLQQTFSPIALNEITLWLQQHIQ